MKDHSINHKTLSNKKREGLTCGQCQKWMTDKCSSLDDARKGILKHTDDACAGFVSVMQNTWEIVKRPHFFAYILNDLEQKVKRDIPTKCTTLITCISAYLKDPLNSAVRGIPGVGKSHNVVTAAEYFPEKDVMLLLSSSPKALMLDKGTLLDKDGNPILSTDKPEKPRRSQFSKGDEGSHQFEEAMKEYKNRLNGWKERLAGAIRKISLQNKIIIFLGNPSEETMQMLHPILSHDVKRSKYKTVKDMMAIEAVIEGFPASLFLQASGTARGKVYKEQYLEEFITRCLTVSPESTQTKISDANELTNIRASTPWDYERERDSTRVIKDAIVLIRDKFLSGSFDIVIPFENLHLLYPKESVRDMRGFDHFIQFLKAFTSLHIFQRPILKKNGKLYVMCSIDDVITVACIFAFIFEQTQTGMEETLLAFYNEIVRKGKEWYVRPLMEQYNATHPKKKVSSDTIRYMMEKLSTVGYVNIRKSEEDKRKNVYDPLVTEAEKPEIVRKLENQPILRSKLKESFEKWLIENGEEAEFYQYEFSSGKEELTSIEVETATNSIVKNSFENVPSFLLSIYEQLDEERLERFDNITYRWCNCRGCKRTFEIGGKAIIPQNFGHANIRTSKIFISRPVLKRHVDMPYGMFLLDLIRVTLHEMVHILFPEFDEEQTTNKTWEWLKDNKWVDVSESFERTAKRQFEQERDEYVET